VKTRPIIHYRYSEVIIEPDDLNVLQEPLCS